MHSCITRAPITHSVHYPGTHHTACTTQAPITHSMHHILSPHRRHPPTTHSLALSVVGNTLATHPTFIGAHRPHFLYSCACLRLTHSPCSSRIALACCPPISHCTSLFTLYPSLIAHHSSPCTHHSSLITLYPSLTSLASCPPVTHHSAPITHHPVPITHCSGKLPTHHSSLTHSSFTHHSLFRQDALDPQKGYPPITHHSLTHSSGKMPWIHTRAAALSPEQPSAT